MDFLLNEIFFSIQGRGPIRDRAQRGAGEQRGALFDMGVVGGAEGRAQTLKRKIITSPISCFTLSSFTDPRFLLSS